LSLTSTSSSSSSIAHSTAGAGATYVGLVFSFVGEMGDTGAEDRRLVGPPLEREVDERRTSGLSSFCGTTGEELDGAKRIQPHPTDWRVAPTVDRARRRYDDAREWFL